jgi:cyanophycinase
MQHPKGYLIAIGGAEDKGSEEEKERQNSLDFFTQGILNEIVGLAGKKADPKIEVVTSASSIPDEVGQVYKKAFRKLGCIEIGHLKIPKREDADSKKTLERLEKCNCILFSGGDQLRLCSTLGGTEFMDILRERYEREHFVIAGTSAGAAAMSNTMICGGDETKAYLKGKVELSIGFGFLREVIIDTHFDARGRFGRLVQAIAAQPGAVGIGLDEDTGVIIEKGTKMRAIGSSSVVVVDGTSITHNNIADIKGGMPISVANLVVHIMTHSDVFDINNRDFTAVSSPVHV